MHYLKFPDAKTPIHILYYSSNVVPLSASARGQGDNKHGRRRFSAGKSLTDEDYREVAQMLGVEVAAIKAVVEIEAGPGHKGFWEEGKPIINFDLTVYKKRAAANKVNLSKAQKKYPEIFMKPNRKKYGSQQAAQYARLTQALEVDTVSAIEGTFWGMFQIGGFNYKLCGTSSPMEFMKRMCRSGATSLTSSPSS